MQHESDAARELRELDTFLEAASRKSGRPRGEVAETLLRAITAELLPDLRCIETLRPALNRVAKVAEALGQGQRTRFDPPNLFQPVLASLDRAKPRVAVDLQQAMRENPNLSSRALAKVTGWSPTSVLRAKRRAAAGEAVAFNPPRLRVVPQASAKPQNPTPTVLDYLEQHPGATFTNQKEIARAIGVSQATVSRQLKRLEAKGRVNRKREWRSNVIAYL